MRQFAGISPHVAGRLLPSNGCLSSLQRRSCCSCSLRASWAMRIRPGSIGFSFPAFERDPCLLARLCCSSHQLSLRSPNVVQGVPPCPHPGEQPRSTAHSLLAFASAKPSAFPPHTATMLFPYPAISCTCSPQHFLPLCRTLNVLAG